MDKVFSDRLPSEATVEGMGNHALLSEIGSPKAWVLTPTQHVERETGYDGSLEGYQKVVIQYKRLRGTNTDGFSVGLNEEQHANLRRKYSEREAFYCFSDALTYDTVSRAFRDQGTGGFLHRIVFVSVQEVPVGIKTIRFRKPDDGDWDCQVCDTSNGRSYSSVRWRLGHEWLDAFSNGQLGHRIETGTEEETENALFRDGQDGDLNTGKENHFYAPVAD